MTITVKASIIHQIVKEVRQQSPKPPVIRGNLHSNSVQVVKLIRFLDEQLAKNGLAHSHSKSFDNNNTLSNIVKEYLFVRESLSFLKFEYVSITSCNLVSSYHSNCLDFGIQPPPEFSELPAVSSAESYQQTKLRRISNLLTRALHYHIYREDMTTGDHLPIIFYNERGKHYLYIALLSLTDNITIDETTGDILDIKHIDASALKIACRIDLDMLMEHSQQFETENYEPQNYIAWIQRGSSEKIAEYIQNFMPVMFRLDDNTATTKIMKTLNAYLSQSIFNDKSRKEIHSDVLAVLNDKAKHKTLINITEDIDPIISIKAQSVGLDITDETSFKNFRENNGYGATDEDNSNIFAPAKKPLQNFEMFDFVIGGENFIKIHGKQIQLGDKIKINDNDASNPILEIRLNPDDLLVVQKAFDKAKQYDRNEDTNAD